MQMHGKKGLNGDGRLLRWFLVPLLPKPHIETIKENLFNLSIPLYVQAQSNGEVHDIEHAIEAWKVSRVQLKKQTNKLFQSLTELEYDIQGSMSVKEGRTPGATEVESKVEQIND